MVERDSRLYMLLLSSAEMIPLLYLTQYRLYSFDEEVLLYTQDTFPYAYVLVPTMFIVWAVFTIASLFLRQLIHPLLISEAVAFVGLLLPSMPMPFSISSTIFLIVLIVLGLTPLSVYYFWRLYYWQARRRLRRRLERW